MGSFFPQFSGGVLSAGRYRGQVRAAELKHGARPYWRYVAVRDLRTRHSHREMHGKVFRYDDKIWDTIYPPNGFNCRCRVDALTKKEAEGIGGIESSRGKLKEFDQYVSTDKTTDKVLTTKATRYVGKNRFGEDVAFAPSPGFGYNPGKTNPKWDFADDESRAKAFLPKFVKGFGGKKTKFIEKTWEDYGLPSARIIKEADLSNLNISPRFKTGDKEKDLAKAREILYSAFLGDKLMREIKTPIETILIRKDMLEHVIAKEVHRARFANLYLDTLRKPLEIWLSRKTGKFRKRYVKLYEGKNAMLVIVEESSDGNTLFFNAIPIFKNRLKYFDNQRSGVLLYPKLKRRGD